MKDEEEHISAEDMANLDGQIEKLAEKLKSLKEINMEKTSGMWILEVKRILVTLTTLTDCIIRIEETEKYAADIRSARAALTITIPGMHEH